MTEREDDSMPLITKDVELGDESNAASATPDTTYYKVRKFVHHSVEGTFDSVFEYFILFLIILNVLAFMIGTIEVGEGNPCQSDCVALDDKYSVWFESFEAVSVVIFTIEYVLRMWACMEFEEYAKMGPIKGRLRYAVTFFCLVDLVSIVPFYIGLIPGVPDWDFWTAIRGFRLIRLLKADKYVNAFSIMGSVLSENTSLLVAASYYAILCLVLFSTILYYTEHDSPYESAKYFQSIPQALFPTTLMLTGEFPISDFSPLGQFFACLIAVVAVAIFAVPTAVLGSGFVKAVQDAQCKQFTVDM